MFALLSALLTVLSAWAVLWIVLTGLGLFVRRCFGLRLQETTSLLFSFWIGWAFTLFFLQLWYVQFRVDWRALALLSAVASLGLLWNWNDLWTLITKNARDKWIFCGILLVTAIWLADHAIRSPSNYDSGLYHLGAVRWAASFPAVPGLANLHPRFGFHSSYFLYAAMLEAGPWINKSHHLANGVLLQVLIAQLLLSGFKLFRNGNVLNPYHLFNVLILPLVLKEALDENISSPSPDFPVFVLGIFLSSQLLLFTQSFKTNPPRETAYTVFFIATLGIAGITIKPTFFAFGLATYLLVLLVYFFGIGRKDRSLGKIIGWTTASTAVGLASWMANNAILTGYLAFPSILTSIPVEWRVPCEFAVITTNWVRGWARRPFTDWAEVLGNSDWFKPWVHKLMKDHRADVISPLVLAFSAGFFIFFCRRKEDRQESSRQVQWLFFLPPIASLVFWFLTAPDPRFAGASLWIIAAGGVSFVISRFNQWNRATIFYAIFYLWFVFPLIPPLSGNNFYGPGSNGGFYPTRKADLDTFVTRSGLRLYAPKDRDLCWDTPLPCTPYPNPHLRLRQDGDMSQGFVLDSTDRPAKTAAQLINGERLEQVYFKKADSPAVKAACNSTGERKQGAGYMERGAKS